LLVENTDFTAANAPHNKSDVSDVHATGPYLFHVSSKHPQCSRFPVHRFRHPHPGQINEAYDTRHSWSGGNAPRGAQKVDVPVWVPVQVRLCRQTCRMRRLSAEDWWSPDRTCDSPVNKWVKMQATTK